MMILRRLLASPSAAIVLSTGLFLLGSGCASGPRVTVDDGASDGAVPGSWSEVETVDLFGRDVTPPAAPPAVEHAVPAALLESRADDGVVEEVAGWRVQVFSSIDRNEALVILDAVEEWIERLDDKRREELGLSATVQEEARTVFVSPYYRVRVGNYRSRDDAIALQHAMERRFPQLLVVPDRVRVTRN